MKYAGLRPQRGDGVFHTPYGRVMKKTCTERDTIVWFGFVIALAAATSRASAAPGIQFKATFGLILGLSLGPFLEHLLAVTSITRWALDLSLAAAALLMISLRFTKETRVRIALSYVGVALWYSTAFLAVMNHCE